MKPKKLMISYLFMLVLSCIPREDPPEAVIYLQEINTLPQVLSENSGLISYSGLMWYINDSGNEPEIYGYSREQNIVVKTIFVKGVANNDWEDITQNTDHVFIGDFGNNAGNRTDLSIIRLNKADLLVATDTIQPSGIIYFSYEDQSDFSSQPQNTPYDCEAFIATSDSIYVFTKDWVNQHTRVYSFSAETGTHTARFRAQLDVEGLITSAAWSSQTLILLGYTPIIPFVWTYSRFNPNTFSFSSPVRSNFENYAGVQTEGITITDNGTVAISSEAAFGNPARLFFMRED